MQTQYYAKLQNLDISLHCLSRFIVFQRCHNYFLCCRMANDVKKHFWEESDCDANTISMSPMNLSVHKVCKNIQAFCHMVL